MEEFIIVFLPVPGSPGEGDYYFDDSLNRIRRVELFAEVGIKEKNFIGFKKVVPFLCSAEYFYPGDKIVYQEKEGQLVNTGILQDLYQDRGTAVIETDSGKIIAQINQCFYPILEIFCGLDKITSQRKLTRDEIEIRTVCPKCHRHSRTVSSCGLPEDICHKTQIKEYAFIKQEK